MNPIIVVFGSEKFVSGLLFALGLLWIAQYPKRYGWQVLDIRKLFNKKPLEGTAIPLWGYLAHKIFGIRVAPRIVKANYWVALVDMGMSAFMTCKSFDKPSLAVMLSVANVTISIVARIYTSDGDDSTTSGISLPAIHVPSIFGQFARDFRKGFVDGWNETWGKK